MQLEYLSFKDIDLNDPFFKSLKEDYAEFPDWFSRKSESNAYVFKNPKGLIDGFLYHKVEHGVVDDVTPPLPPKKRVKIGTFKINAHGTRMGERFVKKTIDFALLESAEEVYVTIFSKHEKLIEAFKRYGFHDKGRKHTQNGDEFVLVKEMGAYTRDIKSDYPFIDYSGRKFVLSIYPQWHSRLLPDSILNNENPDAIVNDISHANSIHKIYLTKMYGVESLKKGDILVIYRTSDNKGPAHYRSVATSVCIVEEVRDIRTFYSEKDFLDYAISYSIFSKAELTDLYRRKRYPTIIKFCYNTALIKRVTRQYMIEEIGINPSKYWGFFELTNDQFEGIVRKGYMNESLIINKT